jgi:hypothetical protein
MCLEQNSLIVQFFIFVLYIELVFTKIILQISYLISEIAIHSRVFMLDLPASIRRVVKSILFWCVIGLFIVCLTVWENVGMPENYRLMMDYESPGKKGKNP